MGAPPPSAPAAPLPNVVGRDTKKLSQMRSAAAVVVKSAFADVDAYADATRGDRELTFGELDVADFCGLCRRFTPRSSGRDIFWDLGSGVGSCVIGVALADTFSKCAGIEIQRSLHDHAVAKASLIAQWRQGGVKEREEEAPAASESLASLMEEALTEETVSLEALAARIVARRGHKAYKAALRAAGSASLTKALLKTPPDPTRFLMDPENGTITLLPGEKKLVVKKQPRRKKKKDLQAALALLDGSTEVCLVCGDIFDDGRWHEATVVFCNVLLFSGETLARLVLAMANLAPATHVLSTAKFPPCKWLELLHETWCRASWTGGATLFVYRRTTTLSTERENNLKEHDHDDPETTTTFVEL